MKSILLTSTALVAFAGASFADSHAGVDFGADATLGYNDDVQDGFYWDLDIDVTLSQTLDNGLTAGGSFTLGGLDNDGVDDDNSNDLDIEDYVLFIESDTAGLYFGTTETAGEKRWDGVSGDTTDGFLEGVDEGDAVIRGDATFGGVSASVSYFLEESAGSDHLDGLQVAAVADLGGFTVVGAYQAETDGSGFIGAADAVMGVSVAGAFSGVDVMGSYLTDGTETSIGVSASAPVGPVVIGGYYSMNDVAEDNYGVSADYENGPITVGAFYDFEGGATSGSGDDVTEFGVEGSYDTGMNLVVKAGFISTDDSGTQTNAMYAAGEYDLGNGASVLVSYATDEADDSNDEIGDPEYMHGTTVEVSFSF